MSVCLPYVSHEFFNKPNCTHACTHTYARTVSHVGSRNENANDTILDAKWIYFALRMQSEFGENEIVLIYPVQCIPFFSFSLISISVSEGSREGVSDVYLTSLCIHTYAYVHTYINTCIHTHIYTYMYPLL